MATTDFHLNHNHYDIIGVIVVTSVFESVAADVRTSFRVGKGTSGFGGALSLRSAGRSSSRLRIRSGMNSECT